MSLGDSSVRYDVSAVFLRTCMCCVLIQSGRCDLCVMLSR